MKQSLFLIIFFFTILQLFAQPWKFEEEFNIAYAQTEDTNYIYRRTDKKDNIFIEAYLKSDTLLKVFEYSISKNNGKKDGDFRYLNKEGKMVWVLVFQDGFLNRLLINFVDNSLGIYEIKDNLLNGVYFSYYPNGKIKENGFYKDNTRIGEWKFFYDNGNVEMKGTYSGTYDKLLYDYKAGNLIRIDKYLDTISVEKMNKLKFDSLRILLNTDIIAYPLHFHYETGFWQYFDDSGQLIKKELFENGKLIKIEKQKE